MGGGCNTGVKLLQKIVASTSASCRKSNSLSVQQTLDLLSCHTNNYFLKIVVDSFLKQIYYSITQNGVQGVLLQ